MNYSDLAKHGFTDGCPQCDHNARFMKSKGGLVHSENCRKRLLDELMATPEGRVRLEAYEGRSTKRSLIELRPQIRRPENSDSHDPSMEEMVCPRHGQSHRSLDGPGLALA